MRSFNTDTERFVISWLMRHPEMADRILAEFVVDDFYLEIYRDIFKTAKAIRLQKLEVDIVTLQERLHDKYKWSEFSFIDDVGFGYIPEGMMDSYIAAIKNQRRERELAEAVYGAYETINNANEQFPLDVSTLLSSLRQRLHDISVSGIRSNEDAVTQLVQYNEQLCQKDLKDRVHCPMWAHLDDGILWQKKTLNAIAARPGGGKSSFLIHLFTQLADANERGMYFSVEVKLKAFFDRMASCLTDIPKWVFRDRQATEQQRGQAINCLTPLLDHVQIRFKDRPITMETIASDLYRFQQEHGRLDFFIVDYLQIIDLSEYKFKKRYETLKQAAEVLRDLADQLNAVCFIGVQVGREYEKQMGRENRLIMLSDFRESGDIENTVDTAIGLNVIDLKPDLDKMTLQIIKNREGKSGLMVAFEHDKVRNFWQDVKIIEKKDDSKEAK